MIFRLWKEAYCLQQQLFRGSKLVDQESACRVAGHGADRLQRESQGWIPLLAVLAAPCTCAHKPGCCSLLPNSCQCNASRIVQQWKANNRCSVVRGHLLQVQFHHLSSESAALWQGTLGRDVFSSWRSLFAPNGWLQLLISARHHPGVLAVCLSAHRETWRIRSLLFPVLQSQHCVMSQLDS